MQPRTYATPQDLNQSGPVYLRPWQLNWHPEAGLRGYCDPVRTLVGLLCVGTLATVKSNYMSVTIGVVRGCGVQPGASGLPQRVSSLQSCVCF